MKKPNNKIRGVAYGYGILNMYGDFWHPGAFESEESAQSYMDKFIAAYSTPEKFKKHKIIPVKITPLPKRKPLKTK